MKKILLALVAVLSLTWAFAQDTTHTTIIAPAPKVVTIDTQVVGGQTFFVIADELNGLVGNVRVIAAPIIENPPQKPIDWVMLIIKLLTSGVLASLGAQGLKIWKEAKSLFVGLGNEWIVLIASSFIGLGWLYLETKFVGFDVRVWFANTAKVFALAIIAWRAGLYKWFQKKETAPAPTPTL